MTEEFLHFIWKFRLYHADLTNERGEYIQVVKTGEHNMDAGPDFLNAQIRIGATLWAGNIELHIKASDWFVHKHQNDQLYDNIILHVVYINNVDITRKSGEAIPTVCLERKFDFTLFERYRNLMENINWIPCQNLIQEVDPVSSLWMIEKTLIERLQRKTKYISRVFESNNHDWEETLYRMLARNFGFRINAEPFEMLAQSLPYKFLYKHRNDIFQMEALLFGQAGMLKEDFSDVYPRKLYLEYKYLKKKYDLEPNEGHLWKFLRMRPYNFPNIRIAQFAQIFYKEDRLFSKITEATCLDEIISLFNPECSEYWISHFIFDKPSENYKKTLGRKSLDLILINTVVPIMFFYDIRRDKTELKERAIDFLHEIPYEKNKITRKWKELGIEINSAFESQALLELKEQYCDKRKCLQCRIGMSILNKTDD